MQTLRPYVPEQDENSAPGLSLFRGDFKQSGKGAGTPGLGGNPKGAKVFGPNNSAANGKSQAAPPPRRALGNITNLTPAGKGPAGTPAPKSFAAPTPAGSRRALGDITNRGGGGGPAAPSAKKQLPQQPSEQNLAAKKAGPVAAPPQGSVALSHAREEELSRLDALAELYAKDGIEASAGRTWEEQREEEQRRQAGLESWVLRDDAIGPFAGNSGLSKFSLHDPEHSFVEESDLDDTLELETPEELPIPDSPASSNHSLDLRPGDLDAILDALAKVDTSALDKALEEWEE
mmetsp:Transcript_57/g.155  ORF Transcript_57/g.155 Transcript_57/m.155 type:complete len:290 (-) Transcript_57:298-1167(-)|eukprot:CAMPEP_0117682082 /NCGR_PEP_ID=MMETSP0804-20121206/19407_1 /TAXON_ID=1074897 /ORGANISM="Tetraselmis astigmatica, Strain CCMP880" /LENGTH=289 /DNA_ID=CAMNT_0005492045 /DNA_START=377 /DNA_END=1246 /DNA_ORIENTATION=-